MYVHPQFFTQYGPAEKAGINPVIKLSRVSCIFGNFCVFFFYFHRKIIVHRDTDTFFLHYRPIIENRKNGGYRYRYRK
jgi:hypothetical protein